MVRILFAMAFGLTMMAPAIAQQPGEVVLSPISLSEDYQALQGKDAFKRKGLFQSYKTMFNIDMELAADRERFGKEFAVYRAFKDSFGSYRMNLMTHSRLSVRPGAPAGGSVVGYSNLSRLTLDVAGRKDPLLSDGGDNLYLLVTDSAGAVLESNRNWVELVLDPAKSQSVTWSSTAQIGYGLYDGRPATGKREDARVSIPDRADIFVNVRADDFAKNVRWLGPVKTYTNRITLDSSGNWTWLDESMGINLKGKIE